MLFMATIKQWIIYLKIRLNLTQEHNTKIKLQNNIYMFRHTIKI